MSKENGTNPELGMLLGGIASDVKHILVNQEAQNARLDRHDMRLRSLETSRAWLIGAVTVTPTIFAAVGAWFVKFGGFNG